LPYLSATTSIRRQRGRGYREQRESPLLTSDYIVDELLTLLRSRNEPGLAILAGERLLSGKMASIEHVTPNDFNEAWDTFRTYRDKEWSFTDCTSRAIMRRLEIESALAFDDHFRQFGLAVVLP